MISLTNNTVLESKLYNMYYELFPDILTPGNNNCYNSKLPLDLLSQDFRVRTSLVVHWLRICLPKQGM